MKLRVGITQRVKPITDRNERWDVLDQAWTTFLQAVDVEMIPIPNAHPDPVSFLHQLGIRNVIFSGGNNISSDFITSLSNNLCNLPPVSDEALERDKMELTLLQGSLEFDWTIIGVCRGMQMLNIFHGGCISSIARHVGILHEVCFEKHIHTLLGSNFNEVDVNSFHNFGIANKDLAKHMTVWARATEDDSIEAFSHDTLPHYGIMWHPERFTQPQSRDVNLFRRILSKHHIIR